MSTGNCGEDAAPKGACQVMALAVGQLAQLGLDLFAAAMWGVQPWFCLTADTVHLAVGDQCNCQGLMTCKPLMPSKSLVLRVMSVRLAARAMAAICASSVLMGLPAR